MNRQVVRLVTLGAFTATLLAPALAPGIPSVAEAALPGYEVITCYGFFAPAGIPDERKSTK